MHGAKGEANRINSEPLKQVSLSCSKASGRRHSAASGRIFTISRMGVRLASGQEERLGTLRKAEEVSALPADL